MSEQDTPASANTPQSVTPPRRRRGWWWKIPLLLLVLLVILVALAPTLASWGPVRSAVLSQVNQRLNGKVQVDDWSLGWSSGVSVSGVKVFDEKGSLILEVPQMRLPISALGAMRGDIDLGDSVIDVNLTRLHIDAQGQSNLQRLVKASADKPGKTSEWSSEGKLPNVHGKLTINILGGTIESADLPEPIHLEPGKIALALASINDPLQIEVNLAQRLGQQPAGALSVKGQVGMIRDNRIDPQAAKGDIAVQLSQLQLAAANPFLKMAHVDAQASGVAQGTWQLHVASMDDAQVKGLLEITNFALGGEILRGDSFRSQSVRLPLQLSRQRQGGAVVLNIEQLGADFDQGKISVAGKLPEAAVMNLSKNQAPGAAGEATLTVDLPHLEKLANQLPHLLALRQGVVLQSGEFHFDGRMALSEKAVSLQAPWHLKNVSGTKDGQRVGPLRPITGQLSLTALPNGSPLPALRDASVQLDSAFATVRGGAKSLDQVKVEGNYDLSQVRNDLGQLFDLSMLQSGKGTFAITATGDAAGNGPIEVRASLDNQDLSILPPGEKSPLLQPRLALRLGGTVKRGAGGQISAVENGAFSLQSGAAQQPTVRIEAAAAATFAPAAGGGTRLATANFSTTHFEANLAKLAEELSPLLGQLRRAHLSVQSGALQLSVNAQLTSDAPGAMSAKANVTGDISGLSVRQAVASGTAAGGAAGGTTMILENQSLHWTGQGQVQQSPAQLVATISAMTLQGLDNAIALQLKGQTVARLQRGADGKIQASGEWSVALDVGKLMRLFPRSADSVSQLQAGTVAGALKVATAEDGRTHVDGDLQSDLTVKASAQTLREQAKVVFNAVANEDFSALSASADVTGSFLLAQLREAQLRLKVDGRPATLLQMVPSAKLHVAVIDLPKAWSVGQALMPVAAAPATPAAGGGAAASPPLVFTSGTLTLDALVSGQGGESTINVVALPDKIAFHRGQGNYVAPAKQANRIELVMTAQCAADAAVTGLKQIKQVKISKLQGELDFGTFRLLEPIQIDDLPGLLDVLSGKSDADVATPGGKFQFDGTIEPLMVLVTALQGKPASAAMPVRGEISLKQSIGRQKNRIQLDGELAVAHLRIGSAAPAGGAADAAGGGFSEDQLTVSNSIGYNPANDTLVLNDLSVQMRSSAALALNVKGRINQAQTARRLENVTLTLTPDWQKLWDLARPLLDEPTRQKIGELALTGKQAQGFILNGSFPADVPPMEALKTLQVAGGVAIDSVDWKSKGLLIKNLQLPVQMKEGVAHIIGPNNQMPPAAFCNDGILDLGDIRLDVAGAHPLLTIPDNKKLMSNVTLNELLAGSLGKFAGSLFYNPTKAAGKMDVTCVYCRQLPIDDYLMSNEPSNSAKAEFRFSISNVSIGSEGIGSLLSALNWGEKGVDQVMGNIKDATVTLENGHAKHQMDLQLGGYTVALNGDLNMGKMRYRSLLLDLPTGALARLVGARPEDLTQFLGDRTPFMLNGPIAKLQPDSKGLELLTRRILEAQAKNLLLGGDRKKKGGQAPSSQPSNPAQELFDLFNRDKKK